MSALRTRVAAVVASVLSIAGCAHPDETTPRAPQVIADTLGDEGTDAIEHQAVDGLPPCVADEGEPLDDAAYVARLPVGGASSLVLRFEQMGGAYAGSCAPGRHRLMSALWFDGVDALQEFSWRGAGGTGAYAIAVYTRHVGSRAWAIRGGYLVDLRTAEGDAFFRAGSTFPTDGATAVAIVLNRLDTPIVAVDDITIDVGR